MDVSPIIIIVLLIGSCLSALLIFITLLSRHRKAGARGLDPIGMCARVESNLEPEGAIILNGELWRARVKHSATPVGSGGRVRIVGASGHLLVVERAD